MEGRPPKQELPSWLEDEVASLCAEPGADRAALLARLVGEHPEHADVLRALFAKLTVVAAGPPQPAPEERPVAIGPYRILDVLGEGGMGTVYAAEQLEPVKRRVALKLIKLGMDSKAVVTRFEQERQALALMDHEGIAKVFDCGTSERGQPFFVMELVKGVPLDRYCDERQLALDERLRLVQQVCAAVQHAHQKGVVHRDLKPGNVLVSDDGGGEPRVKIIDFGLAKAMGQKLVEATLFTEAGQIVGTPEYMAPEQADPTNQDIDTRADVYSLGVMLYQVLVGELPFSGTTLRQAGMLEVQRILREVEPPKPSTKLTSLGDASASEVSRRRRVSTSALRRALRTDLDWVVLKTLEKDRNRRYESAAALAADLQRYLDHEPLVAGPPSAAYRLQKLARRYRVQLTTALLVVMTAVAGTIVAVWYAFDASEQAELAQVETTRAQDAEARWKTEAARSGAVNALLRRAVGADDFGRAPLGELTLRSVLDEFEGELDALAAEPMAEASVREILASAYQRLAQYDLALAHVERAQELRLAHPDVDEVRDEIISNDVSLAALRREVGELEASEAGLVDLRARWRPEPADGPADRSGVVRVMYELAKTLQAAGRLDEADAQLRECLDILEASSDHDPNALVHCLAERASLAQERGALTEAEQYARRSIEAARDEGVAPLSLAGTTTTLASVLSDQGRHEEAVELARQMVTELRTRTGAEGTSYAGALHTLGIVAFAAERWSEAEAAFRELIPLYERTFGVRSSKRWPDMKMLATALLEQGEFAAAEELCRRLLDELDAADSTAERLLVPYTLSVLGHSLALRGEHDAAEGVLRQAAEAYDEVGAAVLERVNAWRNLAHVYLLQSEWTDAAAAAARAVGIARQDLGPRDVELTYPIVMLLDALVPAGRLEEAEPLAREVLEIRAAVIPDSWYRYNAMSVLGGILIGLGRFEEAEPYVLEGFAKMDAPPEPYPQSLKRKAALRIPELYDAWGKPERAAEWRRRLGLAR